MVSPDVARVSAIWGTFRRSSSMSRLLFATPASPAAGGTMDVITFAPASSRDCKPSIPSISREAGMSLSGIISRITAMILSSSSRDGMYEPAIGIPSWGTKVMARTWSYSMSRMVIIESTRSSKLSPTPVSSPSSTSIPWCIALFFTAMRTS